MNFQLNKHNAIARKEFGFVLPTSLLLLTLLSMLATTMYYVSRASLLTSSSANTSTTASYYAETAINYISWAISNDAEFDNFSVTGTYVASPFGEPPIPANAPSVGDRYELKSYLWDPGPTGQAGINAVDTSATAHTSGQVMYFDNSQMGGRHLCMENASLFPNCVDITLNESNRTEPSMSHVSTKLPRYIKLDMSSGDSSKTPAIPPSITASIPSLPHRSPPEVEHDQLASGNYDHNGDIPKNGAIVWLTAADPDNNNHDLEIFPLDPAGAYGGVLPSDCHKNLAYNLTPTANACPCLEIGGQVNTGSVGSNNGVHWEATTRSGNDIVIQYTTVGPNVAPISVGLGTPPANNPNAIVLSVSLATDSRGASVSQAWEVIDAVFGMSGYLTITPNLPSELQNLTVSALKLPDGTSSNGSGVVGSNLNGKTLVHLNSAQACNANTGEWLSKYNIAAYAIGYVNGKPSHALRAVIK